MDENQKKLIEEQMQNIPEEVRNAIKSSDWERIVFNIGREHKMHIDDIDVLSIETILTMIGLEHPKDFPENVQKRTGVNDEELSNIVDEINSRLFSKIRDALKVHYEKVATGEIMADEEKDELHHAGVDLDENYRPKTEKRNIQTMVDNRPKPKPPVEEKSAPENIPTPKPEPNPEIVTEKKEPQNVPEQQLKDNVIKIPEIKFDPYREPIE